MYRNKISYTTTIEGVEVFEGEMLEDKIKRMFNNGQAIEDTAPLIYTERKDGVNPSHNIRTDRFEMALEATDHISRSRIAKRESMAILKEKDGEAEPTHGTNEQASN